MTYTHPKDIFHFALIVIENRAIGKLTPALLNKGYTYDEISQIVSAVFGRKLSKQRIQQLHKKYGKEVKNND